MTKSKPTNVGDGSRTDAHGGNSRGEMINAFEAVQREYHAACAVVRNLQTQMGELASRLKGRRPTDPQYHTLIGRRNETNQQLKDAETAAAELRARLNALKVDLREGERTHSRSAQLAESADLLRQILTELRSIRIHIESGVGSDDSDAG